jgi:hypothetical protein
VLNRRIRDISILSALTHSKVLDSLARVPPSPQENGVGTGGRPERELVEGERLAAGFEDALLGAAREAECGDGELGHLLQPHVVRHGPDLDDDLGGEIGGVGGEHDDFGEGEGGLVRVGEEETAEDDFVEFGVGAAG